MENLSRKIRSKKLNARVDLTAMVSVSFLLIIFFMVTIELAKPKAVDLTLPEKEWNDDGVIRCGMGISNSIITVLLDENNKIILYSGVLAFEPESPKEIKYGKNGIRSELFIRNKNIKEYSAKLGKLNRGAIVIIKPSNKCNFKNLIDILDEMAIAKIDTYTIVNEFSPEESKLLVSR